MGAAIPYPLRQRMHGHAVRSSWLIGTGWAMLLLAHCSRSRMQEEIDVSRPRCRPCERQEEPLRHTLANASRLALAGVALIFSFAPAAAQAPQSRPWLDPALLAAAKAEGTLTVYSSTNEQEGLPLFKIFEEATGLKVQYVRGSDSVLTSRMTIEFRANQKSYDIVHMTTINKLPPQLLEVYEPAEAKNTLPEARDPGKRWYGVYANYNSPAYNTQKVKASDLPKTYEEFAQHKEWAGQVAIDGTDNEWLKALFEHYGEQKGTQVIKDMVAALKPIVTDGHLAMARAT